jgi:hypothetical protein
MVHMLRGSHDPVAMTAPSRMIAQRLPSASTATHCDRETSPTLSGTVPSPRRPTQHHLNKAYHAVGAKAGRADGMSKRRCAYCLGRLCAVGSDRAALVRDCHVPAAQRHSDPRRSQWNHALPGRRAKLPDNASPVVWRPIQGRGRGEERCLIPPISYGSARSTARIARWQLYTPATEAISIACVVWSAAGAAARAVM